MMTADLVRWCRVFSVSFALLSFQIGLTRFYSAIFMYHYAFLITSVAILGLGLGSFWALRGKRVLAEPSLRALFWSMAVVTAVFFALPYMPGFVPYLVAAAVPFFAAGTWFARLYALRHRQTAWLYFADLVGAAAAAILVLTILDRTGLFSVFVLATAFAGVAAMQFQRKWLNGAAALFLIGLVVLGAVYGPVIDAGAPAVHTSPFGTRVRYGGEIVYSAWDSFARTDVFRVSGRDQEKLVSIDGGSLSGMWRYDGTEESVAWGRDYIGFLPLDLGARDDVLLIGSGGGRDVHLALLGGHKQITAVEINHGSIEAVRNLSAYAGDIYSRENVQVVVGDGRSYVRSQEQQYDIIYLAQVMAQAADVSGYALAESYIYTQEAFADYLDKLKPTGYLGFMAHDETDLLKLITTAVTALTERGVPLSQVDKHLALAHSPQGGRSRIHSPALLVKLAPFSAEELEAIQLNALLRDHTLLHVPGMTDSLPARIAQGQLTVAELIAQIPYDIRPATDMRPFFYKSDPGIPGMLMVLLFLSGLAALVLIGTGIGRTSPSVLGYFGILGASFMLVEVPLLQFYTLFTGHPSRSITMVLASLLLSAGLGSLVSKYVRNPKRLLYGLPLLIILYPHLLPLVFAQFAGAALAMRTLVVFVSVLPLGMLMGIPFPTGLTALGSKGQERSIPLAWGINGIMSVFGATLAIVLAMVWGFAAPLYLGAVLYAVLAIWLASKVVTD